MGEPKSNTKTGSSDEGPSPLSIVDDLNRVSHVSPSSSTPFSSFTMNSLLFSAQPFPAVRRTQTVAAEGSKLSSEDIMAAINRNALIVNSFIAEQKTLNKWLTGKLNDLENSKTEMDNCLSNLTQLSTRVADIAIQFDTLDEECRRMDRTYSELKTSAGGRTLEIRITNERNSTESISHSVYSTNTIVNFITSVFGVVTLHAVLFYIFHYCMQRY